MSRQRTTHNHDLPPAYQSPRGSPLASTDGQNMSSSRPLPTPRTDLLHPAYIPHFNHRTAIQNHVSFSAAPQEIPHQSPRSPPKSQPTKPLQHVIKVTTVNPQTGEDIQSQQPTSFWLPSPQTPRTLSSRRSGLHSFYVPPKKEGGVFGRRPSVFQKIKDFVVKYFAEWWLLEILSWCFSAACMATIVIVLNCYDNKPIPQWPRYLTLNAFISVFSGFARAALLLPTAEALGQLKWNIFRHRPRSMLDFERLDTASRGPWGAFLLLLQTKRLSLSSVGAAIVLLSLPVDLFFQQIVHYTVLGKAQDIIATTPAATIFLPRDSFATIGGVPQYRPPLEMAGLGQSLLVGDSSMPELKANCPTSNCTWPAYDTLGVCSKCAPITGLYYDCLQLPYDWDEAAGRAMPNATYAMETQCGYFLNLNGTQPVLMSGWLQKNGTRGPFLGMRVWSMINPFSRIPYNKPSIHFPEFPNAIRDMIISGTPDGPNGAARNATPDVQECVLYWCVQTIEASYYWGRLQENVTNIVPLKTQAQDGWRGYTNITQSPTAYVANFSLQLPSRQVPDKYVSFNVSNTTMAQTIQIFDPIAPSFVFSRTPDGPAMIRWINSLKLVPPTVQPLPNKDNPWLKGSVAHITLIAKALSITLRNAAPDTNGQLTVEGCSWTQLTYVQIRWAWIALPATLLGASLAFLVATVVRSSLEVESVGIWKTSALAILFNGLGEDVQNSVGPNCRMGEARKKAGELMVCLEPE